MTGVAALGVAFARHVSLAPTLTTVAGLALAAFFIGIAVWSSAAALRTRAVLWPHRLDYRGPFTSRSVACEEIHGWGRPTNGGRGVEIRMKPGRGRKILLHDGVSRDALFDTWLARFPNLDAEELQASRARVHADRTLGATPTDVAVRLKRGVWLARIGAVLALLSLLVSQFGPRWWITSADIAVALALPLVAVLASVLFRGLVVLRPTRNDARASLFLMVMLPIFGPPIRLLTQVNLQGGEMFARCASIAAVVGILLSCIIRPGIGKRRVASTGVWICLGVYVAASCCWLDVWLDRASVQTVQVVVTSRGVAGGPAWGVRIGPTTDSPPGRNLFVSYPDYSALRAGDTACLADHPGLFGLRWAELHPCPR